MIARQRLTGILAGLLALGVAAPAFAVDLPARWKFSADDDPAFADPRHDDRDWKELSADSTWVDQGVTHEGFAWYRAKVVIPGAEKAGALKTGSVLLHLGKVDDSDQTYFNGTLVGETGTLPPAYESAWGVRRNYFINASLVRWDAENVIAVRVYTGDPNGGLYESSPRSIAAATWADFVSVEREVKNSDDGLGARVSVRLANAARQSVSGGLSVALRDGAKRIVESRQRPVTLSAGAKDTGPFDFDFRPGKPGVYRVAISFREASTGRVVERSGFFSTLGPMSLAVGKAPRQAVADVVSPVFVSNGLEHQKLTGYLGRRMAANLEKRLLKVDEARIIAGFLDRPGEQDWIGEHAGKYLDAAANAWRATGDSRLKAQMDRVVYTLTKAQDDDGYLGTYEPAARWTSWDVWVHKYDLLGLLAYYRATGYTPALDSARRVGDLLVRTFGRGPGQRDIVKAGTHVGMAATSVLEPMVDLYVATGEARYLEFCRYIVGAYQEPGGPDVVRTLLTTGRVDKVANGKAYEMLSNITGLVKLYRVTGDKELLAAARIAFDDVVARRLYVTGTASDHEHFHADDDLKADVRADMGEGCVTTTWIQLAYQLFGLTGEVKYLNEIERSVYNALLGSQNPSTGCVSYYTPLLGRKPYACDISCCLSSIPRGIAMSPLFTYGRLEGAPAIFLYEAGETTDTLDVGGQAVPLHLHTETTFPHAGQAAITVDLPRPTAFPLLLRVPWWSAAFKATVGAETFTARPDQILRIARTWNPGEVVQVSFEMPVDLVPGGKTYPGRAAVRRGPQILAVDAALGTGSASPGLSEAEARRPEVTEAPDLLPAGWIGDQAYRLTAQGAPDEGLPLAPFAEAGQTGADVAVWLPVTSGPVPASR